MVILNCNNISQYYCFIWSNKCSLGEHRKKKTSKNLTIPKPLNCSVQTKILQRKPFGHTSITDLLMFSYILSFLSQRRRCWRTETKEEWSSGTWWRPMRRRSYPNIDGAVWETKSVREPRPSQRSTSHACCLWRYHTHTHTPLSHFTLNRARWITCTVCFRAHCRSS